MLDWPDASQTSPTSMFFNTSLFRPVMTISRGSAEAVIGLSVAVHSPLASAVASIFWPANSTVTSSPGLAVPYMGTSWSRCSSMLSAKIGGTATSPMHGIATVAASPSRIVFNTFIV